MNIFKIGSELIEFIAIKTDLFKLINKKNLDNTVNRILICDKGLDDTITKIITLDSDNLPMICEPNKCKLKLKKNKKQNKKIELNDIENSDLIIKKYRGYLLNNNHNFLYI